ncbi:MAG: PLP-dependent aminotransferase family protein [Acidobacteria bacterium]|nr:PLP-dependent aminotransferase family protein [Acidobacteriota bacterium]
MTTINFEQFFSRSGHAMRESAIRKMGTVLADARDMVSFAPGYPTESTFPWESFRAIADDLLRGQSGPVLQYGATRGFRPLLESITVLMASRGITASPDRLTVTNGSQQGLDLVARVLFNPGDVVLVELPSYTGAITAFRSVGAELVGVGQDADGLNLDALERSLIGLRREGRTVKCLYVVPNFQNPTGLLVGLEKRRALLAWAAKHDLLIIEDDPYRDLYFEDVTTADETRPIAADDTDGRVVYLSSFSKTLAPGLRVAWLHAAPALMAKFEIAKQASDLCTSGLAMQMVDQAIRRGVLDAQLPRLRAHYRAQRDVMVEALHTAFGDQLVWDQPRGGFFLWATLTGAVDGDHLLPLAQARGVIFVVGSAFFVNGSGQQHIRLSFSSPTPERIREGVARLAQAVTDAGVPAAASAAPVSR